MNQNQKAKLQMAEAMKLTFAANVAATTGKVALLAKITELSSRISSITTLELAQQSVITGITQNKLNLRLTMQNQTLAIIGPITTFARATSNTSLEQEIGFTLSDLQRTNETLCMERCQLVRDRANANVAALGDYDITAAKITALQTAVTNYGNAIGSPRSAAMQKKSATENLVLVFAQLDATIKDLDGLMLTFRNTNTIFYATYESVKKLVNTGVRHKSLVVSVKDSITGQSLKGVTVSIAGTTKMVKTTAKGTATFYSLDSGNASLDILNTGYVEQHIANVSINADGITNVVIELVKSVVVVAA